MYDYLIATDEGFRQSVKESEGKGDEKEEKEEVKEDEELMKDEEEKEEKKDEEEDESLLGDDENEEEDDEDALFAVSDEDMEDEPVLEVRSHSTPDP